MVELVLLYPANLPPHYRLYLVVTSIIPSPIPVFLEVVSGLNTDATLTDRTALSVTRCNTGPTPQEDVPQEVVHPPLTVSLRPHGDADLDHLATLRTPRHGSTLHRSTVGPSLTSSLPSETPADVTVSAVLADSRVSMPQHWIWQSAPEGRI